MQNFFKERSLILLRRVFGKERIESNIYEVHMGVNCLLKAGNQQCGWRGCSSDL